jgi:hypothetical protein
MESLKLKFDFYYDAFAAETGMSRVLAGLRKLVCLGGVAMLLAGCRLDMHVQPKYLPYEPSYIQTNYSIRARRMAWSRINSLFL